MVKGRDIIVIGASAGGLSALKQLTAVLPGDLPATLCVVVHSSPDAPSALPELLTGAGPLPARFAVHGERFEPGRIYVAPPDRHLLFDDGCLHVAHGPRENGFRPAVDPLFRSAARAHGDRVIGIVLSGGLDDGTYGLATIKRHGGIAIVQDLDDAIVRGMPESAIEKVDVDHVVPIQQMGSLIVRLTNEGATRGHAAKRSNPGTDLAEHGSNALREGGVSGPPSPFTCPECGGALWELHEGELVRFRCHVGHTYTQDGLALEQTVRVERAMWAALRALEETAEFRRRLAERARDHKMSAIAAGYEDEVAELEQRATVIRAALTTPGRPKRSAGARRRAPRRAAAARRPKRRKS